MTQATATTALKAGRQHGGGLVHANQPRATLRSRHQIPSGGAIKSLCCAAAGILPPLLCATAGRVYPTTCVRRAQKLSTPLSSHTRLPAQLVVGYTPSSERDLQLRKMACLPNALFNNGLRNQGERALCLILVFLQITDRGTENAQKFFLGAGSLQVIDKDSQNTADIGRDVRPRFICLLFEARSDAIEISLEKCLLVITSLCPSLQTSLSLYREVAYIEGVPIEPQCKQPFPVQFLSAAFCYLGFPLMPWNRYGYKNCQNRSHRLYPSRPVDVVAAPYPEQWQDNSRRHNQPSEHYNRPHFPRVLSPLPRNHHRPQSMLKASSLPAAAARVHGGAA